MRNKLKGRKFLYHFDSFGYAIKSGVKALETVSRSNMYETRPAKIH